MNVSYDVHQIENAVGSGQKRVYILPILKPSMSRKQIGETISHNCTLTPADVEAVIVSLGELLRDQLSSGHTFHLPEFGYFSIKTCLKTNDNNEKVRGNNIRIRTLNFRPEESLLQDVRKKVHFERSKDNHRSIKYDEKEIIDKMKRYFENNRFITRRIMEFEFNLRQSMAFRWLSRLVEIDILVKTGNKNSPVYLLK